MPDTLQPLRYATAELLLCALSELFPGTLLFDVTVTDVGFQCEVILKDPLLPDALPLLEERMYALVRQDIPIRITEMERHNAAAFLGHLKQKIRADVLKTTLTSSLVQMLQIGNFHDFCIYPCVPSTASIGAFKLLSIHSYQKQIPRYGKVTITQIRGTAFPSSQELKSFLKRLKEAAACDHRRLIPEMQLLSESGESGYWIWEPKGMRLRSILLERAGFKELDQVELPLYKENPFALMTSLFKNRSLYQQSLPQSLYACVAQSRDVHPAQQWGLFRCNHYVTDIHQTVCTPQQVEEMLISSLQFIEKFFKIFAFETRWVLRSSPRDPARQKGAWKSAVEQLKCALNAHGQPWNLDTEKPIALGPQAELRLTDALGRSWATAFVQIDLESPRQEDLTYIDDDKQRQPAAIVTRSLFGSFERFVALLVEQGSKEEKQEAVTVQMQGDKESEESMTLSALLKIIESRNVA